MFKLPASELGCPSERIAWVLRVQPEARFILALVMNISDVESGGRRWGLGSSRPAARSLSTPFAKKRSNDKASLRSVLAMPWLSQPDRISRSTDTPSLTSLHVGLVNF